MTFETFQKIILHFANNSHVKIVFTDESRKHGILCWRAQFEIEDSAAVTLTLSRPTSADRWTCYLDAKSGLKHFVFDKPRPVVEIARALGIIAKRYSTHRPRTTRAVSTTSAT